MLRNQYRRTSADENNGNQQLQAPSRIAPYAFHGTQDSSSRLVGRLRLSILDKYGVSGNDRARLTCSRFLLPARSRRIWQGSETGVCRPSGGRVI